MTDPEAFSGILERLLCSLVDPEHKRSVGLTSQEFPGCFKWEFSCHVDAVGKIVGRGGSRLRLIRLLVEVAGRTDMRDWRLEQPGKIPGQRKIGRGPDAEIPESHNTTEDFELLRDLIQSLGITATVAVSGSVNEGYLFTVCPAAIQDDTALIEPYAAVYSASQEDTNPINLLETMKSLWHVIGATQGVRYRLRVG